MADQTSITTDHRRESCFVLSNSDLISQVSGLAIRIHDKASLTPHHPDAAPPHTFETDLLTLNLAKKISRGEHCTFISPLFVVAVSDVIAWVKFQRRLSIRAPYNLAKQPLPAAGDPYRP